MAPQEERPASGLSSHSGPPATAPESTATTATATAAPSIDESPATWRPDIQGLRAVAVLAVVAFHAGLPLPGGFVGVDMFFVISGYVITGLLTRELDRNDHIDFRRFYLRRIKRLTPALAVMVAVTLVLAALLLSPFGPQQTAAATGMGAMLLGANWVIATTTGDYFDAEAETNPLLNTWSLSVEEQFYLVFPAVLLLGWLLGRAVGWRRAGPIVAVGLVALASVSMIRGAALFGADSWWVGFYSPLNRAWEFAAGALLALIAAGWRIRPSPSVALTAGLAGVVMLIASLLLINADTPFPGKWTFLPVAATVLLIAAGWRPDNAVTRALSGATIGRVGDWSYSIYLWHWPVIVFAVVLWPGSSWTPLAAALASLAPALASYRWVEQPIRAWPLTMPRRRLVAIGGFVAVPIVVAGALWLGASKLLAPAFESGAIPAAREGTSIDDQNRAPCPLPQTAALAAQVGDAKVRCHASRADLAPTVAVLGDSHAWHLFPGLTEQLSGDNVVLSANFEEQLDPSQPLYRTAITELAAQPSIRTVIIGNYWAKRGFSETGLDAVISQLEAAGKTVVIVDDVPDFAFDPFQCQYRKAPALPWAWCETSASRVLQQRADDRARLATVAARHPQAVLVDALPYFCDSQECRMDRGSELLFDDQDHLNLNGSRYIGQRLLAEPDVAATLGR